MPPHSAAASRRAADDEIKATHSQAPQSAKKARGPAERRLLGNAMTGPRAIAGRGRREALASPYRGDAISSYRRPTGQLAACLPTRLPLLGAPRVTKSRRRPLKRRKVLKKARGPVERRLLGNAMTGPAQPPAEAVIRSEGSIGDALSRRRPLELSETE